MNELPEEPLSTSQAESFASSLFPEILGQKRCYLCREIKPLEDFPRDRKRPDGRQYRCKDCKQAKQREDYAANPMKFRERHFKTKFGLTFADIEEMSRQQGGGCAICGRTDSRSKLTPDNDAKHLSVDRLHVDHDNTTGQIRGLLCGTCNRGLGMFFDDPDLLLGAAAYLRGWQAKWIMEEGTA